MNWSRQNDALTPIAGTMISSSNIVERPKGDVSPPEKNRLALSTVSLDSALQPEGKPETFADYLHATVHSRKTDSSHTDTGVVRILNTSCGFTRTLPSALRF